MANQTMFHLNLTELDGQVVRLRAYLDDQPTDYRERILPLAALQTLLDQAEENYYSPLPANLSQIGQSLYRWLDGTERWWASLRQQLPHNCQQLILAISTTVSPTSQPTEEAKQGYNRLAHLPWELLHDGQQYLVQSQHPLILPMRWLAAATDQPTAVVEPTNQALSLLFMATSPVDLGAHKVLDFEAEEGGILTATQTLRYGNYCLAIRLIISIFSI